MNQRWVNKYKKYYEYEQIREEIDNNTFIQNIFNDLLNSYENMFFNLNDKLITVMMKQLPKNILDNFKSKDNNAYNFKNEENKIPDLAKIIHNNNQNLLYFHDFELISSEIYEYLFFHSNQGELEEDKAEKAECSFDKNYLRRDHHS